MSTLLFKLPLLMLIYSSFKYPLSNGVCCFQACMISPISRTLSPCFFHSKISSLKFAWYAPAYYAHDCKYFGFPKINILIGFSCLSACCWYAQHWGFQTSFLQTFLKCPLWSFFFQWFTPYWGLWVLVHVVSLKIYSLRFLCLHTCWHAPYTEVTGVHVSSKHFQNILESFFCLRALWFTWPIMTTRSYFFFLQIFPNIHLLSFLFTCMLMMHHIEDLVSSKPYEISLLVLA